MTQLCSNYSGHKLSVKSSNKHKQDTAYPLVVFHTQASCSIGISNIDDNNFQLSALQELNYTPTKHGRLLLRSHTHVLSMMQITLCVYNASSQLVSSVKSMFVWSLNARKVKQVSMVKPYQINSMKLKAFLQPNHPHHSAAQNQLYKIVLHTRHKLMSTFRSLIRHKTKQL